MDPLTDQRGWVRGCVRGCAGVGEWGCVWVWCGGVGGHEGAVLRSSCCSADVAVAGVWQSNHTEAGQALRVGQRGRWGQWR